MHRFDDVPTAGHTNSPPRTDLGPLDTAVAKDRRLVNEWQPVATLHLVVCEDALRQLRDLAFAFVVTTSVATT